MIEQVREWLPATAVAKGPGPERIAAAVEGWTSNWFGRQRLAATVFEPVAAEPGLPALLRWQVPRKVLGVSLSTRAAMRLISWALDAPIEQLTVSGGDRKVLEMMERAMIADLAERVEKALQIPGEIGGEPKPTSNPFGLQGGLRVSLTDEIGDEILTLGMPVEELASLHKTSLGTRRHGREPLSSLAEALAPTKIAIEAKIGSASIAMGDLRALSPGDVLVLDSRLGQAAQIVGANSDVTFAVAKLTDLDGQVALVF